MAYGRLEKGDRDRCLREQAVMEGLIGATDGMRICGR